MGEFAHVVATFDGSERVLYVDGRLAGRRSSSEVLADHEGRFLVGDVEESWGFFRGVIDEVAVYDYALPGRTRHGSLPRG